MFNIEIAQQEVEKLGTALVVAKNNLKELGGVVKEDAEREQREHDLLNTHKRCIDTLLSLIPKLWSLRMRLLNFGWAKIIELYQFLGWVWVLCC